MAIETIYEREDNVRPEGVRDYISQAADDLIANNHYTPEQVTFIRSVEHSSKTLKEFWEKLGNKI